MSFDTDITLQFISCTTVFVGFAMPFAAGRSIFQRIRIRTVQEDESGRRSGKLRRCASTDLSKLTVQNLGRVVAEDEAVSRVMRTASIVSPWTLGAS
jgi:hypothetical protein